MLRFTLERIFCGDINFYFYFIIFSYTDLIESMLLSKGAIKTMSQDRGTPSNTVVQVSSFYC